MGTLANHNPLRTLVLRDPEGHELGSLVSAYIPDVGDTLAMTVYDSAADDLVKVSGEVTHREWADEGVVRVEVEPS